MSVSGNCYVCEFYDKDNDYCRRAEKAFGSMNDPICLQKMTVILLRDLNIILQDYLYEENED